MEHLKRLYEDVGMPHADLKIVCGGEEMKSHKIIYCQSPFFKRLALMCSISVVCSLAIYMAS